MGEVELASREAVADGLYPSASSNGGLRLLLVCVTTTWIAQYVGGQVATERLLDLDCPALLPSKN